MAGRSTSSTLRHRPLPVRWKSPGISRISYNGTIAVPSPTPRPYGVRRRREGGGVTVDSMAVANGRAAARVVVAALLAGVGLAGCKGADAHPRPAAVKSSVRPAKEPAAAQGGACLLLNFEVVEQIVGTRFNVAGSGQSEGSFTCVLRTDSAPYPD